MKCCWLDGSWAHREVALVRNNQTDEDNADEDPVASRMTQERVFASSASLFSDGVSSGDVIQGNLGDCWFLSNVMLIETE